MNILVTGATGFIGGAFVRAALEGGHRIAALTQHPNALPSKLPVLPMAGSLEAPPWREIESFEPECCVHCAWITTPQTYLDSPKNRDFLEWSKTFATGVVDRGADRFLALGTCIEYAPSRDPLSEGTSAIDPRSPYARSKVALHDYLRALAAKRDFALAWGRVFYPFGPGEHPGRLLGSVLGKLRLGEPVELRTAGSVKDYIYIDDLARAMLAVITARFHGPINLGTGKGVSVEDLARIVARESGCSEALVRRAAEPGEDPYPFVVADPSLLHGLGWEPRIDLTEGVRRLIAMGSVAA